MYVPKRLRLYSSRLKGESRVRIVPYAYSLSSSKRGKNVGRKKKDYPLFSIPIAALIRFPARYSLTFTSASQTQSVRIGKKPILNERRTRRKRNTTPEISNEAHRYPSLVRRADPSPSPFSGYGHAPFPFSARDTSHVKGLPPTTRFTRLSLLSHSNAGTGSPESKTTSFACIIHPR